jgi:hypothetical protein
MIISDSFVISVPYESNVFHELILFLARFQYTCLVEYAEPMRGAVSVGNMLKGIGERIIGPAFIRAHKIEMENAIFPRIIVDKNIIDDSNLCPQITSLPIVLDKDGLRYIDFMATNNADMNSIRQQAAKRRSEFEFDEKKLKILQKWDWLYTFLDQKEKGCLDCCKTNTVAAIHTP